LKKRSISFCMILIILGSVLLGGCNYKAQTDSGETNVNKIEEAAYFFIVTEAYSREMDEVNYWFEDEQQALLNEMEGTYVSEIKLIRAYLKQYEEGYEAAVPLFTDCINTADPRTEQAIIAKCYYELAKFSAKNGDTDMAKEYISRMGKAFEGTDDKEVLVYLYVYLGMELIDVAEGGELSLDLMLEAKRVAELTDFDNMQYVTFYVAYLYSYLGSIQIAYNYYIDALGYATESNDYYWVGLIYSDIGNNYFTDGDNKNAIYYLDMAYETFSKLNDEEEYIYLFDEIYVVDTLFMVHNNEKNLEEAEKYLNIEKELIDMAPEGKAKSDNMAKYYCSVAEYFCSKEYYSDAVDQLNKAQKLYAGETDFYFADFDVFLYLIYGKAYRGIGNMRLSMQYYEKVLNVYVERGETPDEECLKALYELAAEQGKKEAAIEYAEMLIESLSQSAKDNKQRDAEYLLEAFQTTKKEAEINDLKYRNYVMNIVFASCVFLAGITSYLVIVSYRKNKTIKKLNSQLVKASQIDELTQLNNRRSLNNYLEKKWDELMEEHIPLSVVMFDVDFFKMFNDYYGHIEGDNVLSDIALSVEDNLGEDGFASRYGGEEFLLVLPDTDKTSAEDIMRNIQRSIALLRIPHAKSSVADTVTISVGIATTEKETDYMTMIRKADEALYSAKSVRNTIVSVMCE